MIKTTIPEGKQITGKGKDGWVKAIVIIVATATTTIVGMEEAVRVDGVIQGRMVVVDGVTKVTVPVETVVVGVIVVVTEIVYHHQVIIIIEIIIIRDGQKVVRKMDPRRRHRFEIRHHKSPHRVLHLQQLTKVETMNNVVGEMIVKMIIKMDPRRRHRFEIRHHKSPHRVLHLQQLTKVETMNNVVGEMIVKMIIKMIVEVVTITNVQVITMGIIQGQRHPPINLHLVLLHPMITEIIIINEKEVHPHNHHRVIITTTTTINVHVLVVMIKNQVGLSVEAVETIITIITEVAVAIAMVAVVLVEVVIEDDK